MNHYSLFPILGVSTLISFGIIFFIFSIFGIIIAINILWIWMLIDVIQRKFPKENDQITWILVIIFTHWLGALLYYFMVKKKDPYQSFNKKIKQHS